MKKQLYKAMRVICLTTGGLSLMTLSAVAQPPREGDRDAERGEMREGPRGGDREGEGAAGPRGDRGGRPAGGRGMGPLMRVLDGNNDGEISSEEIDSAVIALKKLDRNGDGKLTVEELAPVTTGGRGGPNGEGRGPGGPEGEGRGPGKEGPGEEGPGRGGRGPGGPGPGGPNGGGRGMGGVAGFNPEQVVERLFQGDKDNDGYLTADELPGRFQNMLKRLDSDADDKLSREELAGLASFMEEMRGGRGEGAGRGPGGRGQGDRPEGRKNREGDRPEGGEDEVESDKSID